MARSLYTTALLCAVAIAPAAMAQQPQRPMMPRDSMPHERHPGMDHDKMMGAMGHRMPMGPMRRMGPGGIMGGNVASMLLGQTAALKLSDAQVTRLASLARAAEAQQAEMRTQMEAMHKQMMANPPRAGAPMAMPADMEARMKAAHDQMHANVRDALAVLTPDQLAMAWMHRGRN